MSVDTDLCANCTALDGTYFKTVDSNTYALFDSDTSAADIQPLTLTLKHDNLNMTGYQAADTVAVDEAGTVKVDLMTFFAITDIQFKQHSSTHADYTRKIDTNKDYDGFLGLAREYPAGATGTFGPLWLKQAKAQNTVANEIVGFYLTGSSGSSYVNIGDATAPTSALKNGDVNNLVTIKMPRQNMFWH